MTTIEKFTELYLTADEEERQRFDDFILGATMGRKGSGNEHVCRDSASDSDVPADRQPLKEGYK